MESANMRLSPSGFNQQSPEGSMRFLALLNCLCIVICCLNQFYMMVFLFGVVT